MISVQILKRKLEEEVMEFDKKINQPVSAMITSALDMAIATFVNEKLTPSELVDNATLDEIAASDDESGSSVDEDGESGSDAEEDSESGSDADEDGESASSADEDGESGSDANEDGESGSDDDKHSKKRKNTDESESRYSSAKKMRNSPHGNL